MMCRGSDIPKETDHEQIIADMKNCKIYLKEFPDYYESIRDCKHYIFYYKGTYYDVQFNPTTQQVVKSEAYSEDKFLTKMKMSSGWLIPNTLLGPYSEIPEILFTIVPLQVNKRGNIFQQLEQVRDGSLWFKIELGKWYLSHSDFLGWFGVLIDEQDNIRLIGLWDDRRARQEIETTLAAGKQATAESVRQEIFDKLTRLTDQVRAVISQLKSQRYALPISAEREILYLDHSFYDVFIQESLAKRFLRIPERRVLDEIIDRILHDQTIQLVPISEEWIQSITSIVNRSSLLEGIKKGILKIGGGLTTDQQWFITGKDNVLKIYRTMSGVEEISEDYAKYVIDEGSYWIERV